LTLTSQYTGKCKVCGKEWKVGNEIWYQKEPKAICIDEQCFERQKSGTTTLTPPTVNYPPPTGNPPTAARTESERTEDAKHMIEILWQMASAKALEVIPMTNQADGELFWQNKDRIILAEVLYKSLTYSWTRP